MASLGSFSWKQSHPLPDSALLMAALGTFYLSFQNLLLFIPSNQVLQKQSPPAVFTVLTSRCFDWENLNL